MNLDPYYLDNLNPSQRAAVEYKDGPALVIAGAGSGKTRVLTYKIVNLLLNGFEPYRIMALTFTNKAANEMKERIKGIVGEQMASKLWMGTFHSIFLRILRIHAEKIGFKSSFTIYDASDSKALLKMIIKDLGLDEKIYKPSVIASRISYSKNALISADQYISDPDNMLADKRAKRPMTGRIFKLYSERCKISGAMDFDDILYYMNVLLRDNPDILRHYSDFFRYILVDEYQDTNFAQHLIISRLSEERRNLCVVGDDAQSIYSFRGANIKNILDMDQRIPGLRIFKLEQNYRSTKNIINAAGSLIDKNTRQMKKHLFSNNPEGEPVTVMSTYSDIEEAYLVSNMISQSKLSCHDSYDEYAVLYRTNAQSRVLEEALRKRNIPYRIYGGLSFYQRKEVKDAICYFRLALNPDDDEALRRIINYPARGIGDTTMRKLQATANEHRISMWRVIADSESYPAGLNSGTLKKLNQFREMISEFIEENNSGADAYELGQLIYNRSGILMVLSHDNTPESISRQQNLSELLGGLKDFVDSHRESGEDDISMKAFLSEVQLSTDQDENDDNNEAKVTLMTSHAAKGLEFKHIFIVGVEEELFPAAMSMDSLSQVEEERRLLYVAITRAKETCVMTYSGTRFRNGQTVMTRPSRFLSDINPKYLKMRTSTDITIDAGKFNFFNPKSNYHSGKDNWRSRRSWGSEYDEYLNSSSDSHNIPEKEFNPRSAYSSGRYRNRSTSLHTTAGGNVVNSLSARKVNIDRDNYSVEDRESISTEAGVIKVGTLINHNRFGNGKVIKLEHISDNDMMTVDFGVVGIKKLLLKFAKFTVIKI